MNKQTMLFGFAIAIAISAGSAYWNSTGLPASRKQRDFEETLKNNSSAYVAEDGTIKYGKAEDVDKVSSKLEKSSSESGKLASSSVSKVFNTNGILASSTVMAKLEEGLARELANKGFSANDANIILLEIKTGLESGETNSLSIAEEKLTKVLGLSPERRDAMISSVELAMDDTGGSYSLEDWETCFDKILEERKPNECEEGLISQFKDSVREHSFNNRVTSKTRREMTDIEMNFIGKSIQMCNSDIISANKLFSVTLPSCK